MEERKSCDWCRDVVDSSFNSMSTPSRLVQSSKEAEKISGYHVPRSIRHMDAPGNFSMRGLKSLEPLTAKLLVCETVELVGYIDGNINQSHQH